MSRDLLQSEETRKAMVVRINDVIDFPLIGEDQEEALLLAAVEKCAAIIEQVLPEDFVKALSGETPGGIAKTKSLVVDRINEKANFFGLFSEEQEKSFIETMVDIMISEQVDDTDAEFLFLDTAGQEALWQERRMEVEREVEFSKRRFKREQKNLEAKLKRIDVRLDEVGKLLC